MPKVLKNMVTLADVINEITPSGGIAEVVEIFDEHNSFLQDAPMEEANDFHSHISHIRSRMPVVTGGRQINSGAKLMSAATTPKRESIGILERWVAVDERVVEDSPDPQKTRTNQAVPALEAMMQELSRQLVYGDEGSEITELTGFGVRYDDLDLDNVRSAGGSGGTSIYMIEWGPNRTYMIYPRGAKDAGIENDDKGKIPWRDSDSNPYDAYVSKYLALFGIAIDDDRCVQRLANVTATGSSNNLLATDGHHDLIRMKNNLPGFGQNAVIYCNRDVKSQFDIWALDKANGFYMMANITGQPLAYFQEIPIRLVEQLVNTESTVS